MDLPPPPPDRPPPPRTKASSRNRKTWVWVGLGVIALSLGGVAIAMSQRAGNQATQIEQPVGEDLSPAEPTPSPTPSPVVEEPRTFYFTVPRVVGLPVRKAKNAIREAFENAHAQDQSVSLQDVFDSHVVFRVSKRETGKAEPGTVLEMRNLPQGGSGKIEGSFTVPADAQSGEIVRSVIGLVVATRPIQFPGDSIYIDGTGSAMVTWLDSNSSIHQKTVPLPAWFRVPAGVENFSAQRSLGDGGSIVCQIRYDDKVYAQSRSSGPYAICSVSA
jgi:hypothetical protein